MLSKNPLFNPSEDASPLERYERVRAAGESLVAKIMNHPSSKHFDPLRAASQMGIPVKQRTILFDSEDEMSALTDYSLHDFRPRGQSMMESCEWMPGDLTETEQAFLNAAMNSRTSLFRVIEVAAEDSQIVLEDCLAPSATRLTLTDLNLCRSLERTGERPFLFLRVLSMDGLHFTSGFGYVFEAKHERALIDGYHRNMGLAPAPIKNQRRAKFFLRMNRRIGKPVRTA